MNPIDRRRFLQWSAVIGASAAGVGCGGPGSSSSSVLSLFGLADREVPPFLPPATDEIDALGHVLARLTFGAAPGQYAALLERADRAPEAAAQRFIEEQLAPRSIDDGEADAAVAGFETLDLRPIGEYLDRNEDQILDEMVRSTILRATLSRRQLHEVMVSFWSDHFNIDPSKGDARWFKAADDRDVIRPHAMGRFPDLLRASALSPAMLWYLDGRVNRVADDGEKPNENYARELLELHTLGVHGGYSQQDVMEVARCLSGWTVRERESFRLNVGGIEFRPELHDDGPKRVLGHDIPAGLGREDLDRVLAIVSVHPSTARYIATKLCRRFIADDPPTPAIDEVARAFLRSEGDMTSVLRTLFGTDAFRSSRGVKFKRPFHFIVSCLRATAARTDAGPPVQDALLRMGHMPFHFPTPDGYPLEPEPWTASLLWRWRFALAFSRNQIKGTRVNASRLAEAAGGTAGLAAHLLGRRPDAGESSALESVGDPLALLLASPAFQLF